MTHTVPTENSVRFENAEVTITRGMMVASTMNSVLVALFALFASSFRDCAALQAEILALRHQLAVLHKNAPPRRDYEGRISLIRSDISRFSGAQPLGKELVPEGFDGRGAVVLE